MGISTARGTRRPPPDEYRAAVLSLRLPDHFHAVILFPQEQLAPQRRFVQRQAVRDHEYRVEFPRSGSETRPRRALVDAVWIVRGAGRWLNWLLKSPQRKPALAAEAHGWF